MKRKLVLTNLLFVSLFSAVFAANPKSQSNDGTIDLEPFSFIAAPEIKQFGDWKYNQIDGFEILSSIPDYQTQELLEKFQRFKQALEIINPSSTQSEKPSSIILCKRSSDFKTFLPQSLQNEYGIVSYLLQNDEHSTIVLDYSNTTLLMRQLETRHTENWRYKYLNTEPHKQLYREYIKYRLPEQPTPQPAWLLEGVIQVLQDMRINNSDITYGTLGRRYGKPNHILAIPNYRPRLRNHIPWNGRISTNFFVEGGGRSGWNYVGAIYDMSKSHHSPGVSPMKRDWAEPVTSGYFSDRLTPGPLMPMEEFFSVEANDIEALNPIKYQLWSNMAYAFVHMCRFGKGKEFEKPLETFVKRLATEPLSEELFVECFGVNFSKMRKILKGYIIRPNSVQIHLKLEKENHLVTQEIVLREASLSEIARIHGSAQSMAGNDELARETYLSAYHQGERETDLMAALGIAEMRAGNIDSARRILEAVAIIDTDRPSVWTSLSTLRLREAIANPEENGKLSANQMNYVLAPVLKTLILQPKTPATFHIIAEAWENSAININAVYVNLLGEGALQFPTDSSLTLRVAKLYSSFGDKENAAVFAQLGLKFAQNKNMKDQFQSMIDSLPALPSTMQTAFN